MKKASIQANNNQEVRTMGIFSKVFNNKKNDPKENTDYKSTNSYLTGVKYKDVEIEVDDDKEDSKNHFYEDYNIILQEGIDKIIKEKFIPWLKGEEFKDKDDVKILEGLKVYNVTYRYNKIIAKYSPIEKEGYFGVFEFHFESSNDYVSAILETVAMEIYIFDNKIVKVSGYEI